LNTAWWQSPTLLDPGCSNPNSGYFVVQAKDMEKQIKCQSKGKLKLHA
jgi:hypothetical protein